MAQPQLGITKKAIVKNIVDGDTLDVYIVIPARIRLLDCWAPEIHGQQRPQGLESKDALEKLLPVNSNVIVQIPTEHARSVSDLLTFNRVLGNVWQETCQESVSEKMVRMGFATKTKE